MPHTFGFKLKAMTCLLSIRQQFSGINAIVFYSASVFQDAGSSLDSFVSSIIIGIVQMVFTMISVLLVSIFFFDFLVQLQ